MEGIFAGGVGVVVILFLFVLALLWFLLPFAVFGIKDLLKELIKETRASRDMQMRVFAELQTLLRAAPSPPTPTPPGSIEAVRPSDDRTLGEIIGDRRR